MLGSVFNRIRRVSGEASVRTVLRKFTKSGNPIGYSEFQGLGPPGLDYGLPGDIYVDLTPENLTLYARCTNDWKPWSGPDTATMNLIFHPDHRDRCLWCTGDTYGWVLTFNAYKRLGEESGKFMNLFSISVDKTQHQLLAAAIEKASTNSGHGKRRRFDSIDGHQQNKRLQLSTSSTPPANIGQTQRPSYTPHEVTPPAIQRLTMNQPATRHLKSRNPDIDTSSDQLVGGSLNTVDAAVVKSSVSESRKAKEEDNEGDEDEEEQDQLVDDFDTPDGVEHEVIGGSNELSGPPTTSKGSALPSETPPVHRALANSSQNEEIYFSSIIATHVKPMLQEFTRSQQVEAERRGKEVPLDHEIHSLHTAAENSAHDHDAKHTALHAELKAAKTNALRYAEELGNARAQLDTEQEKTRQVSQRLVAVQEDGKALKQQLEAESTRSLHEAEELQQSLLLKEDLLNQSNAEVIRLRNQVDVDAQRFRDREKEMQNLKAVATEHMAAEKKALQEVARLEHCNALAATRAEEASAEISSLKAHIRVLEDENSSLNAVKNLYEQTSKTTEQLDMKAKETMTELRAAHEEISQLKRENAQLLEQNTARRSTPKKTNSSSHSSLIQPKIMPETSDSSLFKSLRSIHVQALCADMGDHFLCRTCLGSEIQLHEHKLRKGAVLTDSYRDIHEHYMKEHRENYDIVLSMDEDDLHYMTKLMSRSSESQS